MNTSATNWTVWLSVLAFLAVAWLAAVAGNEMRNKEVAAVRAAGEAAGRAGLPPESCPWSPTWHQEEKRKAWLDAWQAGRKSPETKDAGR